MPHLDRKISGIGNQPATGDEIGQAIDRWQLVLLGKRNDLLAMNDRQRGRGHDHAAAAAARESRDAVLGLGEVAHIDREDLHPKRGCHGAWMTAYCPIAAAWEGSQIIAARVVPGTISLSSSSHLLAKLYSNITKPVALPPGRDRLLTKPEPTA